MWWDELERILYDDHFPETNIRLSAGGREYNMKSGQTPAEAYHFLQPILRWSVPDERDDLLSQLRKQAGLPAEGRSTHRIMTETEIKQLARSRSAIIGAHTHRHPALSTLSPQTQQSEIHESKRILKQILSTNIEHFSYPFGSKKDYDENSVRICKEAGFKMVCSNFYGQVHSWTSRYELPRILVRDWNMNQFKENMKIFFRH